MNPLGCNSNQLKDILIFCGYSYLTMPDEKKLFFLNTIKNKTKKNIKKSNKTLNKKNNNDKIKKDPNSPFAVLEKLL